MLHTPIFAPLGLLVANLMVAVPAMAGPPACTCTHLESLQQEYRNAIYLEGFMRQMAEVLKTEEQRLRNLKFTSNADPDGNLDIQSTVLAMRDRYVAQKMRLPFPKVKGYIGPDEVTMPHGSCQQPETQLKAMVAGAPCDAIADATAAHELMHRDLCRAMGDHAYWNRLPSVMTLEKAERYRAQAANLKSEIGRVLEKSELRLHGEWHYTIIGPDVEISYRNIFESDNLSRLLQGSEILSFFGQGKHRAALERMKAADMTCTSDSVISNDFRVTVQTDGLSFDLDYETGDQKFGMTVQCKSPYGEGFGMSLPIEGAGIGSGRLAASQPLVVGDNVVANDWVDGVRAVIEGGGMRLTGDPRTVLSLTCDRG